MSYDHDLGLRAQAPLAGVDQGLRAHMARVYGLMSGALALTGVIAWIIGNNEALMASIFGTPWQWVAIFGPFAMAMVLIFFVEKMSAGAATALFIAYSAAMGVSMSIIFAVYTQASIAQAFGVTAVSFLGLSLYGYTTKRDLGPIGNFLIFALIGLIVASIVNIFLRSSGMDFLISIAGVVIFAGLTAYDTQKIKTDYLQGRGRSADAEGRLAVMGAFNLYLDFVNLMLYILKLMGNRK